MFEEKELNDKLLEEKEEVKYPKTPAYKLKAIEKYNKKATKAFTFRLNKKTDAELIEFVESLPNKTRVFKELFTEEMKKKKK